MGVPVVASQLAPLDELVVDGTTGFLVPPNDVEQWSKKLYQLCTDELLHKTMSERSIAWYRKRFGVEQQVQQVEKIYKEL